MVPCLFYWLWDPPSHWSPGIMRCESGLWMSLWCRSKDVLVSEMGYKTQTADIVQWPKICCDSSHYREWLIVGEFYLHWSLLWYLVWDHMDCVHWSSNGNDTEDRLKPDVFICDSLSTDQNRQSQTRSIMSRDTQLEPGCHILRCHRCLL